MPALMEEISTLTVLTEAKPRMTSHDSGDEFSLDHWMKVFWLVEEENLVVEHRWTANAV